MDVYAIVGAPATRKSTLIRCLTGCYNKNIRDILLENGQTIRLYAAIHSLQGSHITAHEFMKEPLRTRCQAVLFALWPGQHPVNPIKYPDALTYLNDFMIEGWHVHKVLVLGDTDDRAYRQFDVMRLADVTKTPINQSAQQARVFFRWV